MVAFIQTKNNRTSLVVQRKNCTKRKSLLSRLNGHIILADLLCLPGSSARNGHRWAGQKQLGRKNEDSREPERWFVKKRTSSGIREKRLLTKQQTYGDATRWLGEQMCHVTKDKCYIKFQSKSFSFIFLCSFVLGLFRRMCCLMFNYDNNQRTPEKQKEANLYNVSCFPWLFVVVVVVLLTVRNPANRDRKLYKNW